MALSSKVPAPGTLGSANPQTTGGRIRSNNPITLKGAVLPKEQLQNRALNQMQDNVNKATSAIKSLPFGTGNHILGQVFVTGLVTMVQTKLSEPCQGFFITNPRPTAPATTISGTPAASNTSTANPPTSSTLSLMAHGTFTADVWCF